MKYLVDTNVLSEPTMPTPDVRVIRWLRHHEADLAINPVILGEIEYGILLLAPGRRRRNLESWFEKVVRSLRMLEINADWAAVWARLLARLKKGGIEMPERDSFIAATALVYGLTVATRNIADFKNAGVRCVDPFE